MVKIMRVGFACVAVLVSLAGSSRGDTVLYDNTGPNLSGHNPFSYDNAFVANSFTLGATSSLTGVSFNVYTTDDTVPTTDVHVKVYDVSGSSVGTELYTGTFGVASTTVTGTDGYYDYTEFLVDLPSWSLASGTYWIALQADPAQWDMHWTIVSFSPTHALGPKIGNSAGDPGSYSDYTYEHDFTIYGDAVVPEPGSIAAMLSLVGVGGVVALRRRRTKKTAA